MAQVNSRRKFINVNFTMSYEEYEEGFMMPEFHFHNDYEVYILERGNRVVSVGEKEFSTAVGDVMFFTKEELHKSRGTDRFSGICIHFSERFLKHYFTEVAINKILALFQIRKLSLSMEKVLIIREMTEQFVIDDEYNFLKLAKIFEILHGNSNAVANLTEKNYVSKDKKSTQIFTYVDENYAYIENLKELANLFEISEGYLFKLFQNEYGMTPKTYINKLRIKNICNRLKYSERTIKSIAADYGFDSYEHFCRVFKKEMKVSPMEYRKKI